MLSDYCLAIDATPSILTDALPNRERESAGTINFALSNLELCARDFEAALSLFDHCEPQLRSVVDRIPAPDIIRWQVLAARDGAITLYRFRKAMEKARTSLRHCPTANALVNRAMMRAAEKRFATCFPRGDTVRMSLAQALEDDELDIVRTWTPALSHPPVAIRHGLKGRRFVTTYERSQISYELSQQSVNSLHDIKQEFFFAFRGVGRLTAELPQAHEMAS